MRRRTIAKLLLAATLATTMQAGLAADAAHTRGCLTQDLQPDDRCQSIASSRTGPTPHSFDGSCAVVGKAVLADAMGLVPRPSSFVFEGSGSCAGTLDGRTLPQEGVPVGMVSSGPRPIHTCELGYDPGITFALTFNPGTPAAVTIGGSGDIIDVARVQLSVFRGADGGLGVAMNTLQGHLETVRRCIRGTIKSGIVGLQIDTVTPLRDDGSAGP